MLRKTLFLIAACAVAASVTAGNVQVQVLDKDGRPGPDAVVGVYPPTPAAPVASNATIGQQRMRFVPQLVEAHHRPNAAERAQPPGVGAIERPALPGTKRRAATS